MGRNLKSAEKLKVLILFGGRSGEHAVSLMSARSILAALDREKYEITQVGITRAGEWLIGDGILEALEQESLKGFNAVTLLPDPKRKGLYRITTRNGDEVIDLLTAVDVVFPVLHGTYGEDGTLQGLLDMAETAYVGPGVCGSAVGMDKGIFKDIMRANNIPIVEHVLALRKEIRDDIDSVASKAEASIPYPMFTKPANLGSSVGISKCMNRSALIEGMMDACQYDRRILIERGVNAREIEVSVLGNDQPEASIAGEIVPAAEFYSYEAKYHDDRSQAFIPADIPDDTMQSVRELAVRAFRAIDGAGMARVDFLLDKDTGEVFINELNTIPGFTQISMYPKLWEASGLPYSELLDRLIDLALERRSDRDESIHEYRRTG